MSLSSILDSLARAASKRSGGPEELVGDLYDMTTHRYPLDIGNYDKGHYIVFHVNAQDKTQFMNEATSLRPQAIIDMENLERIRGSQTPAGAIQKLGELGGTALGNAIKNTWSRNVSEPLQDVFTGITNDLKSVDSRFVRTIYRTTESVALYMPDSLQFGYQQTYNEPHLSDSALTGVSSFGQSMYDMIKQGKSLKDIGSNMSPFLYNYLSNKLDGNIGKPLFTAISGVVQNPMIEVLYTSPNLRSFNFTFMFYPRSEAEAREVHKIIDCFKFHQAPEVKNNSGGYFLVPPSEFDIKFMYFGKENPNIDKISTCVLENISVDYTHGGQWVAYEVQGQDTPTKGGTGMPVGIAMTLSFKETRIVTKESLRPELALSGTATEQRISDFIAQSNQDAEAAYNDYGPTEADVIDYMDRESDSPQAAVKAGGEDIPPNNDASGGILT